MNAAERKPYWQNRYDLTKYPDRIRGHKRCHGCGKRKAWPADFIGRRGGVCILCRSCGDRNMKHYEAKKRTKEVLP